MRSGSTCGACTWIRSSAASARPTNGIPTTPQSLPPGMRSWLGRTNSAVDDGMKDACAINLHNIVTVPKEGLGRLVVSLDERRLEQVCAAIAFALGCGQ